MFRNKKKLIKFSTRYRKKNRLKSHLIFNMENYWITGGEFNKWWAQCRRSNSWTFKYTDYSTSWSRNCGWHKVSENKSNLMRIFVKIMIHSRCCCFFKRKKKKSPRQKWLQDSQKSPEREAATNLLRAASHSNSRDSCLNPSQDYIQASSQHNIRYPSASVLTSTPTNNTPTLPI